MAANYAEVDCHATFRAVICRLGWRSLQNTTTGREGESSARMLDGTWNKLLQY